VRLRGNGEMYLMVWRVLNTQNKTLGLGENCAESPPGATFAVNSEPHTGERLAESYDDDWQRQLDPQRR
jgi:hypothetical protein